MILYEEDIEINIKEVQDNLNTETSFYKKEFKYDEFIKINKIFEFFKKLNIIFESLKKNFEQNKENILLEKENIIINFIIKLDIIEEEIKLIIPVVQKSEEEQMKNLKDSVYFLNKEKNNLQNEIINLKENEKYLNSTVKNLQEEIKHISKYIKDKLNPHI